MQESHFTEPIAEHIWRAKYQNQWSSHGGMSESSVQDMWDRVALAVASVELHNKDDWRERFRALLHDFRFLPGGRILANAGSGRRATLFNCFVMGTIDDSISGIFGMLREAMVTLQSGGGVGVDFSTLRPRGMATIATGGVASGPVSFLQVWQLASATLESTSSRHGAMMATLRCDHPDIEAFIDAKRTPGALAHFNLSVLVTDTFMQAVKEDAPWPLVFPLRGRQAPDGAEICVRLWSGGQEPELCQVMRSVSARALWGSLVKAAHDCAEPGVLFVDRINRTNNLWYCEHLSSTNPCGEVPLPAHGACNLGSINLARFVEHPFGEHPRLNFGTLMDAVVIATRFLDNIYELSSFPLKTQEKTAHTSRRLGLGITGLADTYLMLGLRYGSPSSLELVEHIMRTIRDTAYRTSVILAREKGAFSKFDTTRYGAAHFVLDLPRDIQDQIATYGIRNSHLLAVAPTGSISLLANNVSRGIEPVFAFDTKRSVRMADGQLKVFEVQDYAIGLFRAQFGAKHPLPDYFVTADQVSAADQLAVQAAVQTYVDNAISKTLRLPATTSAEELGDLFLEANRLGLKGCSAYRMGSMGGVRGGEIKPVASSAASPAA